MITTVRSIDTPLTGLCVCLCVCSKSAYALFFQQIARMPFGTITDRSRGCPGSPERDHAIAKRWSAVTSIASRPPPSAPGSHPHSRLGFLFLDRTQK